MSINEAKTVLSRGIFDLERKIEEYALKQGVSISEIFIMISMMNIIELDSTYGHDWKDDWEGWPSLTYLKTSDGRSWYNKRIWDALVIGEFLRPGTIKNLRRAVRRDMEYVDPDDKECGKIAYKEFSEKLLDFLSKRKKLSWF